MLNDDWKYDKPRREYYFNDNDLAEHDSDLLDKVLEKIKDCSYEMYSDISPYPETVVDMEDIDLIIVGMKAEVNQ